MSCPRKPSRQSVRFWVWLTQSAFVVGLLSLIWFVLRTGTKPSRAAYPCQRVAAANSTAWVAAYLLPLLPLARLAKPREWNRRTIGLLLATGILVVGGLSWLSMAPNSPLTPSSVPAVIPLSLAETRATAGPASNLFAIQNIDSESMGIPALLELMAAQGTAFYRSTATSSTAARNGLISKDDVVILKVNAQWDQRGGTNTDLVKAVIQAIVNHPDGFTGEIIVADNGQAQYGARGNGGAMNWRLNNAASRAQSMQVVVDEFASTHAVSTSLWDVFTSRLVKEYEAGDFSNGYVVEEPATSPSGMAVTYPKFKSSFGTHISFKHGIWDAEGERYDSQKLKIINMPVLKPHFIYGATASVKHYMGVVSDRLSWTAGTRAHDAVRTGGMGTALAKTRFPTLNILDAVHVCFLPDQGPMVYYSKTSEAGIIAASTDPIALDAWAAKNILMQGAEHLGQPTSAFSPFLEDEPDGAFAQYLTASFEALRDSGLRVTLDEARMNVFVRSL